MTKLLLHGLAATLALAPSSGVLALSADQEWLDPPVLPAVFALQDPQETSESGVPSPPRLEAPPRLPKTTESDFPRLTSALDLEFPILPKYGAAASV